MESGSLTTHLTLQPVWHPQLQQASHGYLFYMPGYRYKRSFRLFSRYPAALSVGATDVERALSAIAQQSSQPDSREKRRALIRHSNAHGDPFAICHCSVEIERLVLLPSIIEVMWIHYGTLHLIMNKHR